MPHAFFFSYASEDYDADLKRFFHDLCAAVAPWLGLSRFDPALSFLDGQTLPHFSDWEPRILEALQQSAVFVAVTSVAYFNKPFCGQECWVFNERRKQAAIEGKKPENMVPVNWVPAFNKLPQPLNEANLKNLSMPDLYREKGLKYMRKINPAAYHASVTRLGEAIAYAAKRYAALPPLHNHPSLLEIPNIFAGGEYTDAWGPKGWLPGPNVVNFIFAAGSSDGSPGQIGRYGSCAAEWRPYLPPVPKTVSEIAISAAKKHALRYREIPIFKGLQDEFLGARDRKNLTIVIADSETLQSHSWSGNVSVCDPHPYEGAALLIICYDNSLWHTNAQQAFKIVFPTMSLLSPPALHAPITSAETLEAILDSTLASLRSLLTNTGIKKKEKMDSGPAQVSTTAIEK